MLTRQPNRPLCEHCKVSLAKPNGKSKHGFTKWHKYCVDCAKGAYNSKYGYLLQKKDKCEKCDFIPEDKCLLDIIYKDGNSRNKDKRNLKTLCANCNRLYQKKLKEKIINETLENHTYNFQQLCDNNNNSKKIKNSIKNLIDDYSDFNNIMTEEKNTPNNKKLMKKINTKKDEVKLFMYNKTKSIENLNNLTDVLDV